MTTSDDFDPLDTTDPQELYRTFDRMRTECPVAHSSAYGGFWALTRYEDVRNAASDSRTYISSVRAVIPSDPRGLRRPPLNYDAPDHTPYRRALDRTLQRTRLQHLEPILRRHAAAELHVMLQKGGGDIAQEFGTTFPAWVTAEWLNLGPDVTAVLAEKAAAWVAAWREMDGETVNAMSESMYQIARQLLDERKREPLDPEVDPASSLLLERHHGEPLEEEKLLGALRQCLVVGMVAPPIVFGAICQHLSDDVDLQDYLRNNPVDIPAAVDEFVRLYTPYRGFARTVSNPVTLHGREILPEEPVTLVYAAANRDPEVFPDPEKFKLHRPNIKQHLGFGRGRHRCAGMPLARLSLQIALEELLCSTHKFTTQTSPDGSGAGMPELGPTSVPTRLTPNPHRQAPAATLGTPGTGVFEETSLSIETAPRCPYMGG